MSHHENETQQKATTAAERLRMTLDLFAAGEQMMRQTLRRRHATASAEEIEGMLNAWLQTRPGALWGDGEGSPIVWPRPKQQ
jgi:Rv0078B-related antitoxin